MARIYSVTQLNNYIKQEFERNPFLNNIYVQGEASNVKYHSSGHIYFTVKDQGGAMSAVMFRANRMNGLTFPMKEGDKILVTGSISVYTKTGSYQLYAREITRDGQGDLYARYTELKNKLEKEGLFDAPKKPIPPYARTIGIVTASTGAAIQDIINVSSRRNPYIQLYLYPAKVQGEGAAETITEGIRALDRKGVDVIIIGRGGGSIEDLWAFNEEIVARAVYECKTPIISAVGHETDYTIADFVSDMRAPTPSAAAELAAWSYSEFKRDLQEYAFKLIKELERKLNLLKGKRDVLSEKLKGLDPETMIFRNKQESAELARRLGDMIDKKLLNYKHRYEIILEQLQGLSPLTRLSGGYAYVRNETGKTVKSVKDINVGDNLRISFKDGEAFASVTEVMEVER